MRGVRRIALIATLFASMACAPKTSHRNPTGAGCRPHSGNIARLSIFPSRAPRDGGTGTLGFVYSVTTDPTKRQRALRILENGTWILSEQENGIFVADLAQGTWTPSGGVVDLPPDAFDGAAHVWTGGNLRAEIDGRRVTEGYADCFE